MGADWYPRSARGSADCVRCPSARREEWCDPCKRNALWFSDMKKRLGLSVDIVIDLPRRVIRYERMEPMRDVSNASNVENKFPETLEFPETGGGFVLLGKVIRNNVATRYGERTVIECIERVSKKKYSVWWPKGIPVPTLTLPFMLVRLSKRDWKLVTCDTREEAVELWQTGEVKNPTMNAGDSDAVFA